MATDKNNVKKKKQIKGCTQELMFIANKQTKRGEKNTEKRVKEDGQKHNK